jgi:signal transduction histidine kinase
VSEIGSYDLSKKELYVITEVVKALTASESLPELLEAVMCKIDEVFEMSEFGLVLLQDPSDGVLRPHANCGSGFQDLEALHAITLEEGESIAGKVFTQGIARLLSSSEAISSDQVDMQPKNRALMERAFGPGVVPCSIVVSPIFAGKSKYGVLVLGTLQESRVFSEEDLPFVQTLADLIALAFERARLVDEAILIRDTKNADRLRAEVMATLSHELRTPLTAIKGYSTALLLDEISFTDEKRDEFLQLIDDECVNLQSMITDILDSSLIDVGELAIELQPIRLERLSNEIVEDMQRRTDIHSIVVDFPPGFPIVDADPRRITQVIRNILDNAIKYSPDGGLIFVRGEIRPNDVVISIADQGVGISAEDLIPLFEKYFRVKAATGYHVPGTGLGLPVARSIIEAHRGRTWAESEVSQGTTLYISLPLGGPSSSGSEED